MTASALECHSQPLRPRAAQLAFFSKKTRPFDARRCQSRLLSTKVRSPSASRAATAAQRRAATRDCLARAAQARRASNAPRRGPEIACHRALVRAGLEAVCARARAGEGSKAGPSSRAEWAHSWSAARALSPRLGASCHDAAEYVRVTQFLRTARGGCLAQRLRRARAAHADATCPAAHASPRTRAACCFALGGAARHEKSRAREWR